MSPYPREIRDRMEAIPLTETKRRILEAFKIFLNDFIGGIPTEMVTARTPSYSMYKCRKSFFKNIGTSAKDLITQKLIVNPEAVERCQGFITFYETTIQKKDDTNRVTIEDIKVADDFLTYMINELPK